MNQETNRFEQLVEESTEASNKKPWIGVIRGASGEYEPLPESNKPWIGVRYGANGEYELLPESNKPTKVLLRPNGEPVPPHWCVLTVGETIVIKNYTFKICYIGETSILLEPMGIVEINGQVSSELT